MEVWTSSLSLSPSRIPGRELPNKLFCKGKWEKSACVGGGGRQAGSNQIERAWRAGSGALHDVEVNHRGGDVGVTEQILNRSNVDAALQQVGGETVAQGVKGRPLGNSGLVGGLLELPLQGGFVKVVACDHAGAGVGANLGGRKDPLPRPFAGGIGIFSAQGEIEVGVSEACGKFAAVADFSLVKVGAQAVLELLRQWHQAMFSAVDIRAASRRRSPPGFALLSLSQLPPVASAGIVDGNIPLAEVDALG